MPEAVYVSNYSRLLRGPGDLFNAIVNAAGGEQIWKAEAPEGYNVQLAKVQVAIAGSSAGSMEDYGSIIGGLSTGLQIGIFSSQDDSMLFDLLDGEFIKANGGFLIFGFDGGANIEGQGGNARTYVFTDYDLVRIGAPALTKDTYFGVKLNDDFSSLTYHTFVLKGRAIKQING